METVLKITNLNKSFGKIRVLHDLNLEQKSGEILCISGESGVGKTTLLRCILGLEQADSGEIIISGKKLCNYENNKVAYAKGDELLAIKKELGLVFQNFNLFPHKSVLENIILSPVHQKLMTKECASQKAIKLLHQMNLIGKENMYPYQLSGGQKQRVSIARAAILNPSIICFDEPTSALDDKNTDEIKKIIKTMAQSGIAVLIISHDREFVKSLADKIITLK